MIGAIVTHLIPLFIAFRVYQEVRLDKAWAFFCSSLIAFYLTINMRPYTVIWLEALIPSESPFMYPCVYFVYGFLMTVILYLLLSRLTKAVNVQFPQRIAGVLQLLLVYAGTQMLVILLILSTYFLNQLTQGQATGFLGITNQGIAPVRAFYGKQMQKLQRISTFSGSKISHKKSDRPKK